MCKGTIWLHAKTSGLYRILDIAIEEATMVPVVVYRSIGKAHREGLPISPSSHETPNGATFTRPVTEFLDGRFVQMLQRSPDENPEFEEAVDLGLIKVNEDLLVNEVRAYLDSENRNMAAENVKKLLRHYGVEKANQLKEADLDSVYKAVREMRAGKTPEQFMRKPPKRATVGVTPFDADDGEDFGGLE